jgi:Ca2+-binding EF-hand superfamily protein
MNLHDVFERNSVDCGTIRKIPPALLPFALEEAGIDGEEPTAPQEDVDFEQFSALIAQCKAAEEVRSGALMAAIEELGVGMDGFVDEDSFLALLTTGEGAMGEADALALFAEIDADGNGFLCGSEMAAFAASHRTAAEARAVKLQALEQLSQCQLSEENARRRATEEEAVDWVELQRSATNFPTPDVVEAPRVETVPAADSPPSEAANVAAEPVLEPAAAASAAAFSHPSRAPCERAAEPAAAPAETDTMIQENDTPPATAADSTATAAPCSDRPAPTTSESTAKPKTDHKSDGGGGCCVVA